MNTIVGKEIKFTSIQGGGSRAKVDSGVARTRLVKYPAGSEIPRHEHSKDALHIITRGEIVSKDGAITICGPWEYVVGDGDDGPWLVTHDLEMVVIEPHQ